MGTAQLKDIQGATYAIGDKVATDVTVGRSSGLRIGTVMEFDGRYVKVSYTLTTWGGKERNQSVYRRPDGVVKVNA